MQKQIRLLITGGPGSGATTTGSMLLEKWGIPRFDSDDFFHKPTNPPFQEPFSGEERNESIRKALPMGRSWILSVSISTWGIDDVSFTHAVILNIGVTARMNRLRKRESARYGDRVRSSPPTSWIIDRAFVLVADQVKIQGIRSREIPLQ